MLLSDFDFALPEARIALHPARPRDAARLLVLRDDGLTDAVVRDLPGFLREGDVMVFNDTRVIPAQLAGRRGEVDIALTLLRPEGDGRWSALARPARRLKPGDVVDLAPGFAARLIERRAGGEVLLALIGEDVAAALARHGGMPLPPYIRKKRALAPEDAEDYQTVYAARPGAVAAPTAGLHFTPDLLARLAVLGIERITLTLHVGAGTFLPVKAADIAQHRLHAEYGEITPAAAASLNAAMAAGRRILAVGTTTLRLLESAASGEKKLAPFAGETDIFIRPGHDFRIVDLLMTNFHLPRSTLFMLVAAFAGLERMRRAYAHAIARDYRFFSYGDASLLERAR